MVQFISLIDYFNFKNSKIVQFINIENYTTQIFSKLFTSFKLSMIGSWKSIESSSSAFRVKSRLSTSSCESNNKRYSFIRAFKTTAYLHKVFIFVFPTKNNLSYLHESSVGANRLKQDKLNLLINGKENGNVAFNFEQTEHKLCFIFFSFQILY